ncbi:MAG: DUF3048 domain-containing protein [Patescibacteria group bacterium]|jgi:hypothetical protein
MPNKTNSNNLITWLRQLQWKYVLPVAVFVIILGAGIAIYTVPGWSENMPWSKDKTSNSGNQNDSQSLLVNNSKTDLVARAIDGVLVKPDLANEHPVAIMIDNVPGAWPQNGLEAASVIYETLVEGGATRLMAVFAGGTSTKIGPIRSARPYYLDWVSEYDAFYGHVGGSPDALGAIDGLKIKDFSQMKNGQYFWRDTGRAAPHNVYTSSELIARALRDKNITAATTYEPWKFKDEALIEQRPANQGVIEVKFSNGNTWTSQFKYNATDNTYRRFEPKDTPQVYAESSQPTKVKNVIVQIIPSILGVGEKGRLTLDVSGQGSAYVFRDGVKIEGSWRKPDRLLRTRYYDTYGNEVELNRGTTWVLIIPKDQPVTYTE